MTWIHLDMKAVLKTAIKLQLSKNVENCENCGNCGEFIYELQHDV